MTLKKIDFNELLQVSLAAPGEMWPPVEQPEQPLDALGLLGILTESTVEPLPEVFCESIAENGAKLAQVLADARAKRLKDLRAKLAQTPRYEAHQFEFVYGPVDGCLPAAEIELTKQKAVKLSREVVRVKLQISKLSLAQMQARWWHLEKHLQLPQKIRHLQNKLEDLEIEFEKAEELSKRKSVEQLKADGIAFSKMISEYKQLEREIVELLPVEPAPVPILTKDQSLLAIRAQRLAAETLEKRRLAALDFAKKGGEK